MSSLRGKTLFITGASRGIGLAIALRAARDGANVVIAAKSDVPNPKLPGTILERLFEKSGSEFAKASRACYDDASWVGFRLAEALPLENRERQYLLQMTDPIARLAQLMHYLPRFQSA